MTKKPTNTSAALSQLGNLFQYLIALECCLDASIEDKIYIEKYGDLSDENSAIELKHHNVEDHNLSDRHVDFWKTLNNWCGSYETFKDYKFLILLTTSVINEGSPFFNWNKLDEKEKYECLKKIVDEKVTDSIKKFKDNIFDFEKDKLLSILKRFRIKSSHLRAKEKLEQLKNHQSFDIIPKKNRIHLITFLLGIILKEGIQNPTNWKIEVSDFKETLIKVARDYVHDDIPMPLKYKFSTTEESGYQNTKFVRCLYEIDMQTKVSNAIQNYHRAIKTKEFLISEDISFFSNLDSYEEELFDDISLIKERVSNSCTDKSVNNRKRLSRDIYLSCLSQEPRRISGLINNEKFFQRGSIEHLVDNKNFTWLINI